MISIQITEDDFWYAEVAIPKVRHLRVELRSNDHLKTTDAHRLLSFIRKQLLSAQSEKKFIFDSHFREVKVVL